MPQSLSEGLNPKYCATRGNESVLYATETRPIREAAPITISQSHSRIRNQGGLAFNSGADLAWTSRFISSFADSTKSEGLFCNPAIIAIAPGCTNVGLRPGSRIIFLIFLSLRW